MIVSDATTIMVGLGEVKISEDPESVLACVGLGSCVAISAFDPVAKVGGMAHVVLPKTMERTRVGRLAATRMSPSPCCLKHYEKVARWIPVW